MHRMMRSLVENCRPKASVSRGKSERPFDNYMVGTYTGVPSLAFGLRGPLAAIVTKDDDDLLGMESREPQTFRPLRAVYKDAQAHPVQHSHTRSKVRLSQSQ